MATTDRTSATEPAEAVAVRLREASFAHLLVRADGEALAAAGLLAAACADAGTPYQVSPVRTRGDARALETDAPGPDDGGTTAAPTRVAIGLPGEDGPVERPALTAFEAARTLDVDPDPALALAGVVAGGGHPETDAPSLVEAAGFERRAGLVAPTDEPADALAHTTLAHVPYSGDLEGAAAVVGRVADDDVDRRLASLLAIDAVSAEGATERAADTIERAIHPLAGGPFGTVGGYADVLGALAATAPGRAIALAIGAPTEPALDAWREHAIAAHEGVRSAETERHSGLLVARTDGPVEAVARLLRDFRSPEPAVLVVGDGETALATREATADPIETAAEAAGGSGLARGEFGYARFDAGREADLIQTVEEAI